MEDLQAKTKGKARRSRKKKEANTNTSKPTIVHTKRKEVEGNDGWIHIVDKPRSKKANAKAFTQLLQGGDFEINGVNYVHRTLAEMEEEFDHWKRSWGERPACKDLKERIRDIENARKIQNIVVLGLGSLQSARREGRRASATQLAALQTIVGSLERGAELQLTFQDPQFTDVDKEFLTSLGYKVVDDPEAFTEVGEGSLVYAIHCYGEVYKAISQRPRPAVLIGTNVENFRRFDSSEDSIAKVLDSMVDGCQIIDFPQLRHDFSDTKIYLRLPTVSVAKGPPSNDRQAIETTKIESLKRSPKEEVTKVEATSKERLKTQ